MTFDNSNPISDVRVAQTMPELVAVLDQLVASTRTLIDASFGAETLFREQFKERMQMVHLMPSPRGDLFVTSGLLIDLDKAAAFAGAIEGKEAMRVAYVVTDDDRRFQSVVRQLPGSVQPVRLYESYLMNFRFAMGR